MIRLSWTKEILMLEGWTGSRPANCKPDATRPLFAQILTMFFRNIEPWECSLLFPWFQCVEQKAGAPVWLRLICGPRANSLAVCTIVVLLCHVCTSLCRARLYVVVSRLYVGHNITWRSARHTPLNCFQLWRWIPNAISKFGELYLLRHIVKTSGAAMHSRELRHHFWGTKEIFGASAAVSEQSKKRLLIVIDKHGLRLQLSWALCWQGYHVTNLNTCSMFNMAHKKHYHTQRHGFY